MGLKTFIISLMFITLFAIAIIGFSTNFASDNEVFVDLGDDPEIQNAFTQGTTNISEFRTASEDSYSSIINSTLDTADFTTRSGGQFKITPSSALGGVRQIIRTGYSKIFGGADSDFGVFLVAFISILGFLMGIYIMKAWIGRNPE